MLSNITLDQMRVSVTLTTLTNILHAPDGKAARHCVVDAVHDMFGAMEEQVMSEP